MSWIAGIAGGVRMQIKAQPQAAKNEITGVAGDMCRIRLTAPPVEGGANKQLQKLLGEFFECDAGNATIVRGLTGRIKLVEVTGLSEAEALRMASLPE